MRFGWINWVNVAAVEWLIIMNAIAAAVVFGVFHFLVVRENV